MRGKPAVGWKGGRKMGVRDGRAAPDEATNRKPDVTPCQGLRSLILPSWQVAKNNGRSSNYFCNHLILIQFFIRPKCIVSRALYSLHLLSLSFSTFSSQGNLCLSYVYVRLKRRRLPRKLVQTNKFISIVQIYHF